MSFTPPMPSRDSIREEEREAYDRLVERQTAYGYTEFVKRFLHKEMLLAFPGDSVQPYFCALLNSPLIAGGMSDLGVVYRTRGEYADGMSHADREWIDMVMSEELKCNWVLYVHAPDAVAQGIRAEAILALLRGEEEKLTPDEKLKADFIRAVNRGTMTETLYKAVEAKLGGARACVEFAAFCGHLLKTLRLNQAFGVRDVTREQLIEFVQAIADGKIQLPDPKARVPVDALAKQSK
jgi:alkylhydroperoxidase/carboxymuconolactone decarboxylase family protein YurZ